MSTVVIVILMQIKIGPLTLEDHAAEWARQSRAVEALRGVSAGAVKALTEGYKSMVSTLDLTVGTGLSKAQVAGSRSLDLAFEKSEAFVKEQTNRFRNSDLKKKSVDRKTSADDRSSNDGDGSAGGDSVSEDDTYGLQPESTYD